MFKNALLRAQQFSNGGDKMITLEQKVRNRIEELEKETKELYKFISYKGIDDKILNNKAAISELKDLLKEWGHEI